MTILHFSCRIPPTIGDPPHLPVCTSRGGLRNICLKGCSPPLSLAPTVPCRKIEPGTSSPSCDYTEDKLRATRPTRLLNLLLFAIDEDSDQATELDAPTGRPEAL